MLVQHINHIPNEWFRGLININVYFVKFLEIITTDVCDNQYHIDNLNLRNITHNVIYYNTS